MGDSSTEHDFDFALTKDGSVRISRGGRHVHTVGGRDARRLGDKLARADAVQAQQLLARATGQYKFGNERAGGERRR